MTAGDGQVVLFGVGAGEVVVVEGIEGIAGDGGFEDEAGFVEVAGHAVGDSSLVGDDAMGDGGGAEGRAAGGDHREGFFKGGGGGFVLPEHGEDLGVLEDVGEGWGVGGIEAVGGEDFGHDGVLVADGIEAVEFEVCADVGGGDEAANEVSEALLAFGGIGGEGDGWAGAAGDLRCAQNGQGGVVFLVGGQDLIAATGAGERGGLRGEEKEAERVDAA